ncbi:MAG: hypothetical protein JSS00_13530 [Proteobacteria bacterium]|nr:hypothetical protein [Pseudomonadota bacterium]
MLVEAGVLAPAPVADEPPALDAGGADGIDDADGLAGTVVVVVVAGGVVCWLPPVCAKPMGTPNTQAAAVTIKKRFM